jgi:antitoxin component YwqK of YwqJK toxin-antitoxin module
MKMKASLPAAAIPAMLTALWLMACDGGAAKPQAAATAADTAQASAQNGRVVKPLPDGGRIEGTLRDGKRVGPWHSYFAHGGPRSRVAYVDGVEEGLTEVFYESGLTYYVGQYHQGRNAGTWIFFDEEGNEIKRVEYDSLGVVKQ